MKRAGVQVDARMSISQVSVRLMLSASPSVMTVSDPSIIGSGIITVGTSTESSPPTVILFNNNQELSQAFPSSLSGPRIQDLQIFAGDDIHVAVTFRVGLYCRF